MQDSDQYRHKKAFFARLLTIYGRKPVLEALNDSSIEVFKLHLARSNREDGLIRQLHEIASQRNIEIEMHDRQALSRISKNGKQDQGVAADLQLNGLQDETALLARVRLETTSSAPQFIALDRITNPQNLGMIIRSVAASGIAGLILPRKGCAALSPLVIKSSAGTLFRAPIYLCDDLGKCLSGLKANGVKLWALSSHASHSLYDAQSEGSCVYVLGNETDGVSPAIARLCNHTLAIPMHNGVESLNVAITAALIAFQASSRA